MAIRHAALILRFRGMLAAGLFLMLLAAHGSAGSSSASVAGTTARGGPYWIVVASNRDGENRAYAVRSDGSRLTPLLPRGIGITEPRGLSRDHRTIAYDDIYEGEHAGIYASRADGTGLHRVVRNGGQPELSPNGRQLAFTFGFPPHIAVIGTDGRGRRLLTSGYDQSPSWSPDGKALVFSRGRRRTGETFALVIQPLRGRQRVLVRAQGVDEPKWSPDGRWIAYVRSDRNKAREGVFVIRPNGAHRHRVVRGFAYPYEWSPDGKRLAFAFGYPHDVAVVGVNGRRLRRLHLNRSVSTEQLAWTPDGRGLIVAGAPRRGSRLSQIWTVGLAGGGLHRVTTDVGSYGLVGWTPMAPVLPPATPLLPSERVLGPTSVATIRPISDLSADGPRVAFVVPWTAADCYHVAVWMPTTQALDRFGAPAPCADPDRPPFVYDVKLAGSRAAWVSKEGCGNSCDFELESATLAQPSPLVVGSRNDSSDTYWNYHLRGDGDLLVFNDSSRLIRLGGGGEPCLDPGNPATSICATLRSGAHAAPVDSVSGHLIAIRENDGVAVVDSLGALIRVFPFAPQEVRIARVDGDRLVVARSSVLEVYDVPTGIGMLQRALPVGFTLTDVDGGVAVLRHGDEIMLLRLDDGASRRLNPGRGPVYADLEPPGLYYSYATDDGEGRLVFTPRSDLLQQLP